jgi:hypothetical protein
MLIVLPQSVLDSQVRTTLPLVGYAMLGAGLTYFLVEGSRLYPGK